jgi:hypothetical protein
VKIPPRQRQTVAVQVEDSRNQFSFATPLLLRSGDHIADHRFEEFKGFLERYGDAKRVFLVGFGKSGTTWLADMFGQHPECVKIGERKLIESPDGAPALLSPLFDDNFFLPWFETSTYGLKHAEGSSVRYELARLQSDYLLYRALQRRTWGPNLSDEQTPGYIIEKIAFNDPGDAQRLVNVLPQMYPTAKLIHIVRDPRDVIVSGMYHRYREFRQAGQTNWLTEYLDHCRSVGKIESIPNTAQVIQDAQNIANRWSACVDLISTARTRRMGWLTTVRYEDLIADTPRLLASLYRFVRLDSSPHIVESVIHKTRFETVTKGRELGMEDPHSHARKGVPGDWVNYFFPEVKQAVLEQAGAAMKGLGYKPDLA